MKIDGSGGLNSQKPMKEVVATVLLPAFDQDMVSCSRHSLPCRRVLKKSSELMQRSLNESSRN